MAINQRSDLPYRAMDVSLSIALSHGGDAEDMTDTTKVLGVAEVAEAPSLTRSSQDRKRWHFP